MVEILSKIFTKLTTNSDKCIPKVQQKYTGGRMWAVNNSDGRAEQQHLILIWQSANKKIASLISSQQSLFINDPLQEQRQLVISSIRKAESSHFEYISRFLQGQLVIGLLRQSVRFIVFQKIYFVINNNHYQVN